MINNKDIKPKWDRYDGPYYCNKCEKEIPADDVYMSTSGYAHLIPVTSNTVKVCGTVVRYAKKRA